MKNLINYESFDLQTVQESDGCIECSAMSPAAMEAVKNVCEGLLCREAEDWHNDEDPEHTYEGYVNECAKYMTEMMGQPGYSSLNKTYAE